MDLIEKLNAKALKVRVPMLFYSTVMHWRKSVRETVVPYYKTFQLGIDMGDIEYACYALVEPDIYQFLMGARLNKLANKYANSLITLRKLKQEFHYHFLSPCYQATLNLLGQAQGEVAELNGPIFNKAELIPKFIQEEQISLCCAAYQAQTILAFIFRNHEKAYQNALLTEKYKEGSGGMFFLPVHNFYYSLTLLAKMSASVSDSESLLKQVNQNQAELKYWADYAPKNCQHKYELVEAEKARVLGEYWQAINLYEKAIAGAQKNQYRHEEALAYELAAECYLAQGINRFAQTYLKEAHYRYQQWGALAKVRDLEDKYPQLKAPKMATAMPTNVTMLTQMPSTLTTSGSEWLDLNSIMKAAQILSGEIVLSSLLKKMMLIVIENAGASIGFLLLPQEKQWFIEAQGVVESEEVNVLHSIPLENQAIAETVIHYVERSFDNVVLHDASKEGQFTQDPYIVKQRPKSVLCTPLVNQGKLTGILYLENNLATGAFTPKRLEMLKVLSSQLAISIENALLYRTLEQKVDQRTFQLAQRTEELAQANEEITVLNEQLKSENLRMSAELNVAKQLQQMVLPKEAELEEIEGLDIAGFMEPADEVGGDYYDVLVENGQIKIGIGDVTGHGLESGVLMLMVQTTVRALLLAGIDNPEQFLNVINRTLYQNVQRIETDKNLTLSLLDYQKGQLRLTGQHEEVLVVREGGEIERIDTTDLGFMVGVIPNIARMISQINIQLQKGDGIVLYTDGITEAQNSQEEQYGIERLCQVVSQQWHRSAKVIQQAIVDDVKQYIDTQKVFDDITLLVLKQQ